MSAVRLRSDDRVLLLGIPPFEELAATSRILSHGALVAIGTAEEVDRARARMADFENLMFIEAEPAKIPWRDAYFTVIVVPPKVDEAATECNRLLIPGGVIVKT